jgi:tripeptide aminopeptidase
MMRNDERKRLIDILSIQSKSYQTSRIRAYMRQALIDAGAEVTVIDKQLHAWKGHPEESPVPCYVAHADTVHSILPDDEWDLRMYTKNGDLRYIGWNPKAKRQVGVGGDDKVGLWVCLEAMHAFDHVGCIITIDEEVGCKGARMLRPEHTQHAAILIEADRRGNDDAVRASWGSGTLSSTDWQKHVERIVLSHGYDWTDHGAPTDVVAMVGSQLTEVGAVNLSAGYHFPHGNMEYVSEWDAENCLSLALSLGEVSRGTRWLHVSEKKTYNYSSYSHTAAKRYDNFRQGGTWDAHTGASFFPDGSAQFNLGHYYQQFTVQEVEGYGGVEGFRYFIAQAKKSYEEASGLTYAKRWPDVDVGDDFPRVPKKLTATCGAVNCESRADGLASHIMTWLCDRHFESWEKLCGVMDRDVARVILCEENLAEAQGEAVEQARAYLNQVASENVTALAAAV